MPRSLIKPHLENLSGSGRRLSAAIVERDVEHPSATGDDDEVRAPRHILIAPTGPARRLRWEAGGSVRQAVFTGGDLILHPAGLDTDPRWSDRTELVLFAALPAALDRTAAQVGRSASVELVPRYHFQDPLLHHLAMTLAAEFERAGPPDLLYAESLTHALVAHLVKRYTVEGAEELAPGHGLSARALGLVRDYVGDRLAETITLADVAALAGYSPSHFIELFKRSTGWTPHQYVIERRVEEARRLLVETDLPIAAVALRTGFADQSHLTRTVRRRLGVTPGEIRGD